MTSTSPSVVEARGCWCARRAACAACGCRACRGTRSACRRVVRTPRTCVRVVCGRLDTIDTLRPTSWLTSVDFPTLGRPTTDTNPDRNSVSLTRAARLRRADSRRRSAAFGRRSALRRARARRHAGVIRTDTMRRPCTRSAAELEAVDPRATRPRRARDRARRTPGRPPCPTPPGGARRRAARSPRRSACGPDTQRAVGQALDLRLVDVVLVGDLADDLLEQVFHRDQAGGAAVLVDRRSPCGTSRSASRATARRRASTPARNARAAASGAPVRCLRRCRCASRGPSGTRARRCRRSSR